MMRKWSSIAICVAATTIALSRSFVAAQRPSDGKSPSPTHNESRNVVRDRRQAPRDFAPLDDFFVLLETTPSVTRRALKKIETKWHPGQRVMLLEILPLTRSRTATDGIVELLQRKTGENHGRDVGRWYLTIWKEPYEPHPAYAAFKARLYSLIDRRFNEYFAENSQAVIRLDEIRWGGVRRDGIPPLKNPQTSSAADANYLADSDVVFGVEVNGEARAYPKRILAWHEMVKDVVGGESINGVYCTLCGSMIVYRTTTARGTHYELGTSGFLYRSNKLMYDHGTKSLWSTIKGEPVVGPLVGKGIKLEPLYVVTTTWGKWRAAHPDSRVLSLNTGHRRDYGEGVAYRDYFATDELMFEVPQTDKRLKNKDQVFIVRPASILKDNGPVPLALSVELLRQRRVYHDSLGETDFVVITDETGANRAYDAGQHEFVQRTKAGRVLDTVGAQWKVTEEALVRSDGAVRLPRLPAHRAFWFGWHAAHPNTRLVR